MTGLALSKLEAKRSRQGTLIQCVIDNPMVKVDFSAQFSCVP